MWWLPLAQAVLGPVQEQHFVASTIKSSRDLTRSLIGLSRWC